MEDIKRLREAQGKTQKQLADEMGVERSTVAKWEAGTTFPRADQLTKPAEVLSCSVTDLFNTESE